MNGIKSKNDSDEEGTSMKEADKADTVDEVNDEELNTDQWMVCILVNLCKNHSPYSNCVLFLFLR